MLVLILAGPRLLEPAMSVFAGAPSVAAAHPGSLDVASSRTRVRSDTPMPSSDVDQRMRVGVPRPLDLTLPIAGDDVAQPCNVLRHVTARYKLSFYYY